MKIISSILGALAKGVSWLLVKLGLWVPALYSLLFLIIAAATKTKLSSVSVIFWVGFVITTAFALVFSFLLAFKKFKKKKDLVGNGVAGQSVTAAPVKKEKTNVNLVEGASVQEPLIQMPVQQAQPMEQNSYGYVQSAPPPYVQPGYYAPNPNAYPQYQPYPQQQFQAYHAPYQQAQPTSTEFAPYINPTAPAPQRESTDNSERGGFERYNSPTSGGYSEYSSLNPEDRSTRRFDDGFTRFDADAPLGEDRRRFSSDRDVFSTSNRDRFDGNFMTDGETEQPKIFRTRMDPNLLIYEYSDRLEFYEITSAGLVLRSSEPKNK